MIYLSKDERSIILANLPNSESQCLSREQWLLVQEIMRKLKE